MKTFKENLGRRMALIGGGIIAILIALTLVVSANTKDANADPNYDGWTGMHALAGGNWLTAIVQAPDNATFDETFTFNFTPVSKAGVTATAADMPTISNNSVELVVANGTISEPAAETATDVVGSVKRDGPGAYQTAGTEPPDPDSGHADAKYAENGTGTYWT